MGLLVAVMSYALARHRFAVPAWLAVLATLPVLFDGFEIQLEHLIMSDTLFLFLTMPPSPSCSGRRARHGGACLAAGLLLGVSSTVRPTGLPLLPCSSCTCWSFLAARPGRLADARALASLASPRARWRSPCRWRATRAGTPGSTARSR